MSDVKLSDGRELNFDLYNLSMAEYRSLIDPAQPAEEGDALVGKCCGLSGDEVAALPQPDWRKLMRAFFEKAREPLADPNSQSASTAG